MIQSGHPQKAQRVLLGAPGTEGTRTQTECHCVMVGSGHKWPDARCLGMTQMLPAWPGLQEATSSARSSGQCLLSAEAPSDPRSSCGHCLALRDPV